MLGNSRRDRIPNTIIRQKTKVTDITERITQVKMEVGRSA